MPVERFRGERLQIMLTADELVLLDDFRFKKRMPSRAAAVRELFRRGLAAEGFVAAPVGAKSSDFGVDKAPMEAGGRRASRLNPILAPAVWEPGYTGS